MMVAQIVMDTLPRPKLKNFHQRMSAFGELPIERAARDNARLQIFGVPEIPDAKRFQTPTPMVDVRSARRPLVRC